MKQGRPWRLSRKKNEKYLRGVDRNLQSLVEEIQRLKGGKMTGEDLEGVRKKAEELRARIGADK